MTLDDALAQLPVDSPYRSVLALLMSSDPKARREAQAEIHKHKLTTPYWETPAPKDPLVALAVLHAAMDLVFPAPVDVRERGRSALLLTLVGSATPPLLVCVREGYAAADTELHLPLLTLVASAGTREGAETLVELIRAHGWPRAVHQRFLSELSTNLDHADALFPALLETEGGPIVDLGDLLLRALRADKIGAESVAETPLVRGLGDRMRELLTSQESLRGKASAELSDAEANVVGELALLVDLAGFLDAPVAVIREVAGLPETRVAAFAVASLLRRGEPLDDACFDRIAADHASRSTFYSLLAPLGATSRIPAKWRTPDAFAAADMVGWLSHPGELGRPPDELEKMDVFEVPQERGPVALYVWRFRVADGPWKAGVSGPYPSDSPEGPLAGNRTFSRFDDWDSATAEQHALAVVETLNTWSRT